MHRVTCCLCVLALVIALAGASPRAQEPALSADQAAPKQVEQDQAREELKAIGQEMRRLAAQLEAAEKDMAKKYPHLASLMAKRDELVKRRQEVADEWVGIHREYTERYHRMRAEWKNKERAGGDWEKEFENAWSEIAAERDRRNSEVAEEYKKADSELKAMASEYNKARDGTEFGTSPEVRELREKLTRLALRRQQLIMSLRPEALANLETTTSSLAAVTDSPGMGGQGSRRGVKD